MDREHAPRGPPHRDRRDERGPGARGREQRVGVGERVALDRLDRERVERADGLGDRRARLDRRVELRDRLDARAAVLVGDPEFAVVADEHDLAARRAEQPPRLGHGRLEHLVEVERAVDEARRLVDEARPARRLLGLEGLAAELLLGPAAVGRVREPHERVPAREPDAGMQLGLDEDPSSLELERLTVGRRVERVRPRLIALEDRARARVGRDVEKEVAADEVLADRALERLEAVVVEDAARRVERDDADAERVEQRSLPRPGRFERGVERVLARDVFERDHADRAALDGDPSRPRAHPRRGAVAPVELELDPLRTRLGAPEDPFERPLGVETEEVLERDAHQRPPVEPLGGGVRRHDPPAHVVDDEHGARGEVEERVAEGGGVGDARRRHRVTPAGGTS